MSALPEDHSLFQRSVAKQGDDLTAAGIGLEGIGLMLLDRELGDDDTNALHHAVIGLGAMVKGAGYGLFSSATMGQIGTTHTSAEAADYYQVNAGVPAVNALERASSLLVCVRELLDDLAQEETPKAAAKAHAADQLAEMAKALLDASLAGLITAGRTTRQGGPAHA